MKFIAGLCVLVGVFSVSEVSAQGSINVTADVSCPQGEVTLTCITENVPFTSLGWTHDNRINLDQPPVGHIIGREDVYPLQVDVSSVMGILNFTIINASVESGDSDITAELVIDLHVLYIDLGYRSLQCGSAVMDANFDFATQLGIEAPLGFEINRLDLVYNVTSRDKLEELLMQTRRPAYSSTTCSYTNETYLNTSIAGTVVRTIDVNDSTCMDDVCSVELIGVVNGTGDVNLSVIAGNRFESTMATPSNIQLPLSTGDNFDPILNYTRDCQLSVECNIRDVPLNMVICEVFYGTNSSHQNSEPVPIPFSEEIGKLKANTTYYIEVVYHTRSMEVDIFYHFRMNFTTDDCSPSTTSNLVVIVVPVVLGVLLALTLLVVAAVVIYLFARKRHKNNTSDDQGVTLSSVNRNNPDVSIDFASESAPRTDGFPYAYDSMRAENVVVQIDSKEFKRIGEKEEDAFENQILEKRGETHCYEDVPK